MSIALVPMNDDRLGDTGIFLSAVADLLSDKVEHLDETATRVTDLLVGANCKDREMIVTMQAFDRLKQELEALASTLSIYARAGAALPESGDERRSLGLDLVSRITVASLKDRFEALLRSADWAVGGENVEAEF